MAESESEPRPTRSSAATWSYFFLLLSVAFYVVAFFLPAIRTPASAHEAQSGTRAFLLGFFGLCVVQPVWLANPLYWAGLICVLLRRPGAAVILGGLATCAALSVVTIYRLFAPPAGTPIPIRQGGHMSLPSAAEIVTAIGQLVVLTGYVAWCASIPLLVLAALLVPRPRLAPRPGELVHDAEAL